MYLSKLDIIGFKSFANKTHFDFADGLTGIIGPNGCGKSNIVDAIRWVLGEQKVSSLRSDKMENVIFNGTNERKPLGMAEVSLTIENNKNILPSEYTEVVITRRLFRSGESQYLLNNQPVRLKDIQNLFIDTGMSTDAYSIIELKMVESILSDNKDDRRRLFEEAAGIKKYKMHRRAALRKLDQTQQELTRLNDIIAEVKRSVNSLARQKAKAQRYNEYKAELKHREIQTQLYKYQSYLDESGPLQQEFEELNASREKFTTEITSHESHLEAIKSKVLNIESEFQELQRKLSKEQGKIQDLEKMNLVDGERREALLREKEKTSLELQEIRFKLESLKKQIDDAGPALQEMEDERIRLESQLDEVEEEKITKESELDGLHEQIASRDKKSKEMFQELSRQTQEINRLTYQKDSIIQEKERIEHELQVLSSEKSTSDARFDELENQVRESSEKIHMLVSKQEKLQTDYEAIKQSEQELQSQRESLEKQLASLEKEIGIYERILESYEGYSSAIQYVMQNFSKNGRVIDTLPNLFSIDTSVQAELGAFLSEMTDVILVDSVSAASEVFRSVKNDEKGTLSVLSVTHLNGSAALPQTAEARPVLPHITPAAGHESLVENIFKHVYLTDTLEKAVSLQQKYPWCMFVSPEGYTNGPLLQLRGGSEKKAVGDLIGRKNLISQLKNALEKTKKEHATLLNDIEKVQELAQENRQKTDDLLQELQTEKTNLENLNLEMERRKVEKVNLNTRLESLHSQMKERETTLSDISLKLNQLEPEHEKLTFEYDNFEDELEELRKELSFSEDAARKASDEYNRLKLEVVHVQNKYQTTRADIDRNRREMDSLMKRQEHLETEGIEQNTELIKKLKKNIEDRSAILNQLLDEFGKMEAAKQEKESEYQEYKNELLETEQVIFQVRKQWNQIQERLREIEFKIQENKLKANGVKEQLKEYYNYDIPEEISLEAFNPDKMRLEIHDLQQKIERMGEVNPLAIEEYDKERERLDFLNAQHTDILKAEEELLQTIDELNKTAIEKFNETYEAIRVNFQKVFHEFFAQGEADLELIDRMDPLESDINIKVTPKGRKLQTLTLMSAGEKTLTAISLLFSIYLVKPSPFCILDEVDAPLDDVNIGRYTNALKSFSENTQFIVVTHNKKTMEAVDAIYGVTMEKEGISKVVSVKFD